MSASTEFTVYPAIDVRGGAVVRLAQGDYARETRYPVDPLALATAYARAGATWLHLVDLDAARRGGPTLHGLVRRIGAETGLRIQVGGGVRDLRDIEGLLDAGAGRVVVGSVAIREPDLAACWIASMPARIVVALDARCDAAGCWVPASDGWTRPAAHGLDLLVQHYVDNGLQHLLCTDIDRDGMLAGPALALYRHLHASAPTLRLQASGGGRDAGDVAAARAAGCAGIVLGKALLEGNLRLEEALRC